MHDMSRLKYLKNLDAAAHDAMKAHPDKMKHGDAMMSSGH